MSEAKPKPAADATLSNITVAPGALMPAFWGGRTNFVVMLPHKLQHISLTATASQAKAKITLNGIPIASGQPSQRFTLLPGRTVFLLDVVSPDGSARKTYEVKVHRQLHTPNWERLVEHTAWVERDSAGEIHHDGRMWVLGGYIPELISDVWSTWDGKNWTKHADVPDKSGINIPITFSHDGRLWVTSNEGKLFASPDGARWDLILEKPPFGRRYGAASVVFKGRMWVVGGTGAEAKGDVWSSSDGAHWTCDLETAPWSRRQVFSNVVVMHDKLWLIGGGVTSYQPFKAYRDVWCSDDGKEWKRVTDEAPWPGRIWTSCLVYRNRLWLIGGFRAQPNWQNFDDVWYSADGATWKQLITEDIWEPRHEVSAFTHNDALWVIGGNAWPLKNDVWRLAIPGLIFISRPVLEEYVLHEYRYRALADFNTSTGPVKYRLLEAPPWITIDETSGLVRGTPPALGDYRITLEARDDAGEAAVQSFVLTAIPG